MRATGCGLYAAATTITPSGGAFVVIEKQPRKTGRTDTRYRDGYPEERPIWEDVLQVVGIERLQGRVIDMAEHVGRRLAADPLDDDCTAYVDTTALGEPLRRLLSGKGHYAIPVEIGGTAESRNEQTGATVLPVNLLQSHVTLAFETGRLKIVSSLSDGSTLARAMENLAALPTSGPTRDLAIAGAIAVWAANRHATHGPWASRREPPPDHEAAREVRRLERLMRQRREQDRTRWWQRGG